MSDRRSETLQSIGTAPGGKTAVAGTDRVKAVVFDFGGVLFDWSPDYLYEKLIPDAAQRRHFLQTICTSAWNVLQDGGRALSVATDELVSRHPTYEALIRAYYGRWIEMLRGTLADGMAILQSLHAHQVPVFGLTNWSAETFSITRHRYPFLENFRDIVVSGEELCVKPQARIFEIALRRFSGHIPGLSCRDLVFIDDQEPNVAAARALGWKGIHHTSAEESMRQLRAFGLPL